MSTRRIALALTTLAAIGAAAAVACARGEPPARAIEVSGIVEATEIDLRAELGAPVLRVNAREGDRVEAGAVLVELDAAKIEAEAAAAAAAAREAEARLALVRAGARPEERERARARVEHEEARLRDAERVLRDARKLAAQGIAPKEELERATTAVDVARAALEIARRERDIVEAGAREEELRAAEAALDAARSRADLARLRAADAVIRAPVAAVVTHRYVEPGETVAPGALLLTLSDLDRPRVKVYVGERDLAALRIGARADVTVDGYPGRVFEGRLTRLATEAEFTPRNLQTKEDRVKLVFEAEVEVANADGALKPGMPADVRLPLAPASALTAHTNGGAR